MRVSQRSDMAVRTGRAGLRATVVVAVFVAGIVGWPGLSPTGARAAEGKSPTGGTFTYIQSYVPQGLDVVNLTGSNGINTDAAVAYAIYGALVYDDKERGPTPSLAKSLTTADGTTWTLKLRPNTKFSDGTTLDADAVKFNWERIQDPANRSPSSSVAASIQTMTASDPQTLKIVLKQPTSQFGGVVANSSLTFVGSPTAIRAKGASVTSSPVGAGAFMLNDWVRGSKLSLTRNAEYWDKPRPYIDRLEILTIPDQETRYNTFQTTPGSATTGIFADASSIRSRAQSAGFSVFDVPAASGPLPLFEQLNGKLAPFNDLRVRRALTMAIDPKKLNAILFQGQAEPSNGTLFPPGSPFYEPDLKLPAYNPKKAQALFNEVAQSTGKPVEFTFLASPTVQTQEEAYQALLSSYQNVTAKVETVASAAYLPRLINGSYNAGNLGTINTDPDPGLYNLLHTGGSTNMTGYSNPQMDRALDEGRSSLDQKARKQAYRTVQQLMIRDLPIHFFPVRNPGSPIVYQKDVGNFQAWVMPFFDQLRVGQKQKK